MKTVIQIGTNDGCDHVREFVAKNIADIQSVVLVEPFDKLNGRIRESYSAVPSAVIINAVVVADDSDNSTIYYKMDGDFRKSSNRWQHLVDHGILPSDIMIKRINAININDLLQTYRGDNTFLFIDAEGMDASIINAIDFTKFSFDGIVFESIHADGTNCRGKTYQLTIDQLTRFGYMTRTILLDTVASKSSLTLRELQFMMRRYYGSHQSSSLA